jgi:hypothetical protein
MLLPDVITPVWPLVSQRVYAAEVWLSPPQRPLSVRPICPCQPGDFWLLRLPSLSR